MFEYIYEKINICIVPELAKINISHDTVKVMFVYLNSCELGNQKQGGLHYKRV